MSERKVLNKYYPPDFDPSQVKRTHAPKGAGPKVQTVRLMAPFSMKCLACGEFIYKGRKFNARKETPNEKYLNIQIFRFYIRCTRCSAEITFKTDPMNMDYVCERGARRNFEVWRTKDQPEESIEERLDRLEAEEREDDRDVMHELETKAETLKSEEKIADALDIIRVRNAERNRVSQDDSQVAKALERNASQEEEKEEEESQDAHLAKKAFQNKRLIDDVVDVNQESTEFADAERWRPVKKQKKKSLLPGIVRKP